MEARVKAYTEGLNPLSPDVFSEFCVSTAVYHRDSIADGWEQLTPAQKRQVIMADDNFIKYAQRIAGWCEHDGLWRDRAIHKIPIDRWWWWADMIAAGTYPTKHLPVGTKQEKPTVEAKTPAPMKATKPTAIVETPKQTGQANQTREALEQLHQQVLWGMAKELGIRYSRYMTKDDLITAIADDRARPAIEAAAGARVKAKKGTK